MDSGSLSGESSSLSTNSESTSSSDSVGGSTNAQSVSTWTKSNSSSGITLSKLGLTRRATFQTDWGPAIVCPISSEDYKVSGVYTEDDGVCSDGGRLDIFLDHEHDPHRVDSSLPSMFIDVHVSMHPRNTGNAYESTSDAYAYIETELQGYGDINGRYDFRYEILDSQSVSGWNINLYKASYYGIIGYYAHDKTYYRKYYAVLCTDNDELDIEIYNSVDSNQSQYRDYLDDSLMREFLDNCELYGL